MNIYIERLVSGVRRSFVKRMKFFEAKHVGTFNANRSRQPRLGFAPRSESSAIEPSVQVCSISSLSEFRFVEMS